jgi:HD-GYP domain-containing protein (c-di-GMP phosphodiesterase class II)
VKSTGAPSELLRLTLENAALKDELAEQRRQFAELNRIGIALSAERDIQKLQDLILSTCRRLTHADGASLWLVEGEEGERVLRFASTQNHSIDVPYASFTVPLNEQSMVGYTVISGDSQLVDDAYELPPGAAFGVAAREFDERHGYRTRSMLCVPMHNHAGDAVGAIQLINAKRNPRSKLSAANVDVEVVPFRREDLRMIESIASQAAVSLDNKLLLDSIQALFDGFVQASVTAIESRDPTTYGHSGRVAALTVALAEQVSGFSAEQLKELRYAALLHDFGKVGVREHVLVKEKKLYPWQLELIRARFEVAKASRQLTEELAQLECWLAAVVAANEPGPLNDETRRLLATLAERALLQPDELHLLNIPHGTLDDNERLEIESHVTHTYRFLTKIPWTPAMRAIPDIAYGHHEKLDGSGYPRHLKAPEIPIQARMMTISDIFDALTATDRPYKKAVPVDRALDILRSEAAAQKLDAALLDVFIGKRVYTAAAGYRPDGELLLGPPR